jgi:uncharacterized RDD family membrane protein YckC
MDSPEKPDGPQAPAPQAPAYDPMLDSPEAPPGGWQQPVGGQPAWHGRQLSSWGRRVAATLLDWLILLIPVAAVIALVVIVAFSSDAGAVATGIASGLAYLLVLIFYAPVLMARQGEHNGQTWGKQIVGIQVVRDNGEPVDFGFAFLRDVIVKGLLFGFVGGWFFSIPTIVDYLWPLWDGENRCLHDMVVSTHVVH